MKVLHRLLMIGVAAMLCAPTAAPDTQISGAVKDLAGMPIAAGTVTFTSSGSSNRRVETIKKDGQYTAASLEPGKYDVLFEAPGYHSTTEAGVDLKDQPLRIEVHLGPPSDPELKPELDPWRIALAFGTILVYLLSILITRWYKIAKPSRNFLMGHIESLKSDLQANRRPHQEKRIQELETALDVIYMRYEKPRQLFRQFLFWSQSAENAAWITVHQVERELTAYLSPPEAVQTSLISYSARLKKLGDPEKQIAAAIDTELKASSGNQTLRNQLLAEATSMYRANSDDNYVSLTDWQNKAMWLILVSCLLLMLLSVAAGNLALFVAGGTGGLLSRLMRTLKGSNVPIDYGASWTTLFLSPLFGAFCGWFGVGLVVFLSNPDVALLGKAFTFVSWSDPLRLSTLTLAFVSGFSERFFDSLVAAVDKQAAAGSATSDSGAAKTGNGPTSPSDTTPTKAPASHYDQLRQEIACAIDSGKANDKTKVIAFLQAMGQEADSSTTPDALKALLAKVEAVVGTDAGKQQRYMTEAVRAGFAASQ